MILHIKTGRGAVVELRLKDGTALRIEGSLEVAKDVGDAALYEFPHIVETQQKAQQKAEVTDGD